MAYQSTSTAVRWSPWEYTDESWGLKDLTGYGIDAMDGEIGKVDAATHETGSSYLIVDTGPWIFGKKVRLPAGVISSVDHQDKRVVVNRTKAQIKGAPEFDEDKVTDMGYRRTLGTYYGEGGAGWYEDKTF